MVNITLCLEIESPMRFISGLQILLCLNVIESKLLCFACNCCLAAFDFLTIPADRVDHEKAAQSI